MAKDQTTLIIFYNLALKKMNVGIQLPKGAEIELKIDSSSELSLHVHHLDPQSIQVTFNNFDISKDKPGTLLESKVDKAVLHTTSIKGRECMMTKDLFEALKQVVKMAYEKAKSGVGTQTLFPGFDGPGSPSTPPAKGGEEIGGK